MTSNRISAKNQQPQSYIFMHLDNFQYEYLVTFYLSQFIDVCHVAFYFTRYFWFYFYLLISHMFYSSLRFTKLILKKAK